MKRFNLLAVALACVVLTNCKDDDDKVPSIDAAENSTILQGFATNVALPVYGSLATATTNLEADIITLTTSKSNIDLAKCQNDWKSARLLWEQSEAHLFGPVATDEIDPRIDTWPVNFVDLEAQLSSDKEFTEEYIDGLDHALKGFHPIEYLLFGENGTKQGSDFTGRELEYLNALAKNLTTLTTEAAASWTSGYAQQIITAGSGSTVYPTQVSAFEEMVNGMSGICEEVANGKLKEPYDQKDPSLEESPFAGTSIIDFTNNIKGVKNVYTGKFTTDGPGLDDLVKKHNISLDVEISAAIDAAITSLNNITVPFGEAITGQTVQVENAMTAINDLEKVLHEKLLPFVQQHAE